jgi:hypothetical protein
LRRRSWWRLPPARRRRHLPQPPGQSGGPALGSRIIPLLALVTSSVGNRYWVTSFNCGSHFPLCGNQSHVQTSRQGSPPRLSNPTPPQEEISHALTHELVHAYDHCRARNLDWTNCQHHACSEIRAATLSGGAPGRRRGSHPCLPLCRSVPVV